MSEKVELKDMEFELEKYYNIFMEDVKRYMFNYVDTQGVDCHNIEKSSIFQLYNYFREQSNRQYKDLESTMKEYISNTFVYSDVLKQKYEVHKNPINNSCPSLFDWKNWFIFNFDNFKGAYFDPNDKGKKGKTQGKARIVTMNSYSLNLMSTTEDIKDNIEFMSYTLPIEYPEDVKFNNKMIDFPEDPNQAMFDDDTQPGYKNNDIPSVSSIEQAIAPLKSRLGPIIMKEADRFKSQFVDEPIQSPGGPVELKLTLRYKFHNCSMRPKFVVNGRAIGEEISPPMVMQENTVHYFISLKEYAGLKADLNHPDIRTNGFDSDMYRPTPAIRVFMNDNLKYLNQLSGSLKSYYDSFVNTYRETLQGMSSTREVLRKRECNNQCTCSRFKLEPSNEEKK